MTSRTSSGNRCDRCRLHRERCLCDLVPRLLTRTRLLLILHRIEARKPTNTGQLAAACLPHSDTLVRGHAGSPTPPLIWDAGTQPIYLFPHDDAVPIEHFAASEKPVVLVVPDGTWRQAWKVRQRVPGLREIPCVSLPSGGATRYLLRTERRENGLATIEAIARAMEVLEGAWVREALDRIFHTMVERNLRMRGSMIPTEMAASTTSEGADLVLAR